MICLDKIETYLNKPPSQCKGIDLSVPTDRQAGRQTDKEIDRQIDGKTYRLTDGRTDGQIGKWIIEWTD